MIFNLGIEMIERRVVLQYFNLVLMTKLYNLIHILDINRAKLRRDDTFGAKIQENETSGLFLYRFLRGTQERQQGLVSVRN